MIIEKIIGYQYKGFRDDWFHWEIDYGVSKVKIKISIHGVVAVESVDSNGDDKSYMCIDGVVIEAIAEELKVMGLNRK